MKRFLLALALILAPAATSAQCNGIFANNTVCGNATGAGNLPRPTSPSSFLGSAGGTNGQIQYNNSGVLGGFGPITGDIGLTIPGAVSTIQPNAVTSGKIATGAVTNSKLATNAVPVLATRALAVGLDLSAFTSVQTLGYATAGDGGGATFQKLAPGTPFTDTYINNSSTPPTIAGGSGYTNGTYLGIPLPGSATGLGCSAKVTVAGNVVTAVSLAVPCAGYKVGDILVGVGITGGSGFTWTINAISTPQASFTDSAGNLWQYAPTGVPNVLQFGCKGDWNGTDAGATDNAACLWSAASWASFPLSASQAQVNGNLLYVPRGAYKVCGVWNGTIYTLPVPQGVVFSGPGIGGATLIECSTNNSATHFIELCDSNSAVGQYGCKVEKMTIASWQIVASTGGAASIYSTSGQQFPLGESLEIQPGLKGCIKYDVGLGGAANDIWISIDCEQLQGATNPGFYFNASTTQHILWRSTYGCTGTGCATAIQNLNGRLMVDGLDIENVATGLLHSVTTANNNGVYKNVQQNSNHCTQAIFLNSSTGGNLIMENVSTGCPLGILNGQSGGTNFASGVIRGALMCVSGACAAAVP